MAGASAEEVLRRVRTLRPGSVTTYGDLSPGRAALRRRGALRVPRPDRAVAASGSRRRVARQGRAPAPAARGRGRALPRGARGHARSVGSAGARVVEMQAMAYEKILYDVRDDGVATITLDDPDTRNALSGDLLGGADRGLRGGARRRARALRRAHLDAREGLLRRRQPRPVRRRRAARAQALRHRALPAAVHADRAARQAHHLRRQRPRAGGLARHRAGVRPDRGEGHRRLRHARDQRGRVPVHDHGADLPQRAAQEGERAAAARRADHGGGGARGGDREPGGAGARSSTRRWTSGR